MTLELIAVTLLVGTLISGGMLLGALGYRKSRTRLLLGLVSGLGGLWQLIVVFELWAPTLEGKLAFDTAELLLLFLLAPTFFSFTLHFTSGHMRVPRPLRLAAFAIPIVGAALILWSYPTTDYFRSAPRLVERFGLIALDYDFGPAFYLFGIYTLAITLVGLLLLSRHARLLPPYRRTAVFVIITATVLPWVVSALLLIAYPLPNGSNLAPLILSFSHVIMAGELVRQRFRDLEPVVREAVLESMSEGLIVLDRGGMIVDFNAATVRATGSARNLGRPIEALLPELAPGRRPDGSLALGSHFHFERPGAEGARRFAGRVVPLTGPHGAPVGLLLTFQDVTEEWRARLEAEAAQRVAEERARELDAIRQTMTEISSELELERLLTAILERSITLMDGHDGEIALYRPDEEVVEIVVSLGLGAEYRGSRLRLGEGLMGRVARDRTPRFVQDYHTWEGRPPQYPVDIVPQTVLAAPLLVGDELIGVISLGFPRERGPIRDGDVSRLMLFAQQATIAIQNARLYAEAHGRAEASERLRRASAAVARALEEEESIASILEQLAHVVPYDRATVHLREGEMTRIVGQRGASSSDHIVGVATSLLLNTPYRIVYESRQSYTLADSSRLYPDFYPAPEEGLHAWMGIPLLRGAEVIGMLSLHSRVPGHYGEDDARRARVFADQCAAALENVRRYAALQQLAISDPLTGLYNRRRFSELGLLAVVEAARRAGQPLSLLMMDIDHFKAVNDRYGHPVGDEVLREVALRCTALLRDGDIFARYGGEEFAILLPATDTAGARAVAERLRAAVAVRPVLAGPEAIPITVSVGVATLRDEGERLEQLLARADEALVRRAKQRGRNRVAVNEGAAEGARATRPVA